MGVDISRVRFDPTLDHAGVLMQQGRLLLDADWNEYVAVTDRRMRAAAADLGSTGPVTGIQGVAVVPRTTPDAFSLTLAGGDIAIAPGRMYVDGLLADNHGTGNELDLLLGETRGAGPIAYTHQPYWPMPDPLPTAGTHLAYLDVWDREVTAVEEPDLVESAVGVDATARIQTVWQLRVLGDDATGVTCSTPDADITGWPAVIAPSAGRLTTGTVPVDDGDDICQLPPSGGYRGRENQTYRVEIHTPGPVGTATFKWSRDNGSVTFAIVDVISSTELRPSSLGRDDVLNLKTNDWVEIIDDQRELSQLSGDLRKITVNQETGSITFAPALSADLQLSTADARLRHLRVRRWDQHGLVKDATGATVIDLDAAGATGTIPITSGTQDIVLESGVTVRLDAPGGNFRVGDYWVFAARTNDTSVEPLTAAPPLGIHHHYARIGTLTWPGTFADCRTAWPPVAGDESCDCTVCVTPASHANGTLTIQDAIDTVGPTGGTVCIEAGTYRVETLSVAGASSIRIHGQGPRTLILAPQIGFDIRESTAVMLDDLSIVVTDADVGAAVALQDNAGVTVERLKILARTGARARVHGIRLASANAKIRLRDNAIAAPIGIGNEDSDAPALTAGLDVSDNSIVAVDGVRFVHQIAHLKQTRIASNAILRASQSGITALGVAGAGADIAIEGNAIFTAGAGIRIGTSHYSVRRNIVRGREALTNDVPTDGIVVTAGSVQTDASAIRIIDNDVSDLSGDAIGCLADVGDLTIAGNRVSNAQNGINVGYQDTTAEVAAVYDNMVRDIGAVSGAAAAGIRVEGAAVASIRGNVIAGVGSPDNADQASSVAVEVIACRQSHVTDNQIDDVGGPNTDVTDYGIRIVYFTRTIVASNSVRRRSGSDDNLDVPWRGLVISSGRAKDAARYENFGAKNYATGDVKTTYVVGERRIRAVDVTSVAITVEGNHLTGSGNQAACFVIAPPNAAAALSANECVGVGNESPIAMELWSDDRGGAAWTIATNRAFAGDTPVRIVADPNLIAVVGNLVSGSIDVNGNPLDPASPWAPLNVTV